MHASGDTALVAAVRGGHTECAKLLLAAGATVNQPNRRATALEVASQRGHVDCVKLLLANGAAVNQAADGTPLYAACEQGQAECVSLLCAAGAAANQAREDGTTPLLIACWHGFASCVALLCAANAAVDQTAEDGCSPLFAASQHGHAECAKLLVEAGAAVDEARQDRTMLAANGWSGAGLDLTEFEGWTPLLIAAANGHQPVVALLASHGASRQPPSVPTSAEELAEEGGHADLLAWLQRTRDGSAPHV